MSDRQGLLRLPMTEEGDPDTTSVGDPFLDVGVIHAWRRCGQEAYERIALKPDEDLQL